MKPLLLLGVLWWTVANGLGAEIRGQYVEARTCDVFTGACFANADTGLVGKNAVLAWKIESGEVLGVRLDGLSVVAVVSAADTLGLKQSAPGRAVLIVDETASADQRLALTEFVRATAGDLVREVVAVQVAAVDLTICPCEGNSCAELRAGTARITTRCLDPDHDKACGNETAFYPPLTAGVQAIPAMAVELSFSGSGLNETWRENDRRGAYVGSFQTKK